MAGYIKHSYILEIEIYCNMIVVRTFIRFTIFAFIVSPFSHFPIFHDMCDIKCVLIYVFNAHSHQRRIFLLHIFADDDYNTSLMISASIYLR